MLKEKTITYVVFSAISGIILLLTYRHILECYAFSDDYSLLYNAGDPGTLNFCISSGRPIYGILMKWLFSKFYYISDLKYARMISLFGIVLFSMLLYRAYILAGWKRIEGGSASVIMCLMPAFGLYAAWATTFPIVYGAALAFIAGELCLKSFDWFRLGDRQLKASIMMLGSTVLLIISLMIYQPIAPSFWLFIAIALFRPLKNSDNLFRKSIYCFVIFTISLMAYYILYKATIWPFTVEPSGRSGLTNNFLEKIHWFVKNPFCDALSLFSILQEKVVISITMAVVSIIIIVGMFRRIWRNKQQRWQFILILSFLIPLSYLPNLASIESWSAFRTQGVLGSLVVFYFLLSLKDIFRSRVARVIMPCLLAAFSLMAYKNVTYGLVEPQKKELELIRHALQEPLSQQQKEIIFIRPHWKDALAPKLRYDEYGLSSTYASWVPKSLINLIAREYKGAAFLPIKVYNFKYDYKVSPNEEIAVINAGKLLQEYKQTVD